MRWERRVWSWSFLISDLKRPASNLSMKTTYPCIFQIFQFFYFLFNIVLGLYNCKEKERPRDIFGCEYIQISVSVINLRKNPLRYIEPPCIYVMFAWFLPFDSFQHCSPLFLYPSQFSAVSVSPATVTPAIRHCHSCLMWFTNVKIVPSFCAADSKLMIQKSFDRYPGQR